MIKLLLGLLLIAFVTAEPRETIKLAEDNFVVLRGPIDGQSSSKFISELLDKKTRNLYVYIVTGGGSITAGMQIIQTIKALESSGTNIYCITNVGLSMGFVITQYCTHRYVMDSSILMQHQASFGINGPMNNVNSYMEFIKSMVNEIDVYQAAKLNMNLTDFKEKIRDDWWLIGSDAVKNNAADKLVYVMCDFKSQFYDEEIETLFGNIVVTYSTCPIAKDPYKIKFKGVFTEEDKQNYIDEIMISRKIDRFTVNHFQNVYNNDKQSYIDKLFIY
jgi:ATP-dependent Clp protease protease subunit